ncbi:hypothetical protein F5884DRAFT_874420 [Xylogone sp. PMI_703]|nr:hypothetical protein F5884DRAFT_874420 [Xylogone sp. PMI_703]
MSAKNPTILFLPGSWLHSDVYKEVAALLKDFPTEILTYPTTNMRPGAPDVKVDVEYVKDILKNHADKGDDMVLLMHSAGGLIGNEAAVGFSNQRDRSLTELFEKHGPPYKPFSEYAKNFVFEDDVTVTVHNTHEVFYGDLPREKADYWASKHGYQSAVIYQLKATGDIYKKVPSTYVYAERDLAVPDVPQSNYAKSLAKEDDIIRIDSDHIPFLSHPEELAAIVRNAITKAVGN